MAKIVFVCPSQPSRTPRLVRNADALADAGHKVDVVCPVFLDKYLDQDLEIVRKAKWNYKPIELLKADGSIKISARFIKQFFSRFPVGKSGFSGMKGYSRALVYGCLNLERKLQYLDADLYISQQQSMLPVVAQIADKKNVPYACDLEDVLSESGDQEAAPNKEIETQFLKKAALLFTMSDASAEFYFKTYGLSKKPLVLHNCPSLIERTNSAFEHHRLGRPSIYWFGKTIGEHSCVKELCAANNDLGCPFDIFVRGEPKASYLTEVFSVAKIGSRMGYLYVLEPTPPSTMVQECRKFDILFGSQPSQSLFHQLAIGNKVFTGVISGCALLLEDTIAHQKLRAEINDFSKFMRYRELQTICESLTLLRQREIINSMRLSAWESGSRGMNWESESKKIIIGVDGLLQS
jgi:hypothetical protein